ncbi:MAG: hypothetical protein K1X75_04660 [Leptospirales bacterium]|nr:hypothetical protein [Leptospirales bacterium]
MTGTLLKSGRRGRRRGSVVLLLVLLLTLPGVALLAQSPDLTNMGVLLEQNRGDIRFFDIALSNMSDKNPDGSPNSLRAELIEQYRAALTHDFYANLWYLQGQYGRTHRELKESQNQLQQAYRKILERYLETTWALLEESAPLIVRSRDQSARALLRLGFRDLETTRLFHVRGSNIHPRLHTNQIQYYREGLKRIRRARRFALLALVEAKLPREERPQYQLVTYDDVRNPEPGEQDNDFQRVLKLLINMTGRRLIPDAITTRNLAQPAELKLLEIHQDNYNRLISDRRSIWMEESAKLNTDSFYEAYSLPRRNSQNKDEVPRAESDPRQPSGAGQNPGPGAAPQPAGAAPAGNAG